MKDYYATLGVPKNASKEDIKQAYRKLAHKYHPDKGGDEKKFKEINEAYQVLGDEHKKAQYDQFGSAFGSQGSEGFSGFQGFDFGNFSARGGPAGGWDLNDIFSDFFDGGRASARTRKTRGQNIRVDIMLTLEDAYQGAEKTISLKKYNACGRCTGEKNEPGSGFKACKTCGGSGEIRQNRRILFGSFTHVSECSQCQGAGKVPEKRCEKCRGAGRMEIVENITFKVPAGMHSGEAIKISGTGEYGEGGYGDLFVYVLVKEHRLFERDGDNIFSQVEITFSQAALGADILAKTLAGDEHIKIPAGVSAGEMIKLAGKGMPRLQSSGRGDHYVKITINTPKKFSPKARKLFEELSREGF